MIDRIEFEANRRIVLEAVDESGGWQFMKATCELRLEESQVQRLGGTTSRLRAWVCKSRQGHLGIACNPWGGVWVNDDWPWQWGFRRSTGVGGSKAKDQVDGGVACVGGCVSCLPVLVTH